MKNKAFNGQYTKEYYRSKEGVVRMAYGNMRSHSTRKGFKAPDFLFNDLLAFALKRAIFHELYALWSIDYDIELKPSFDNLAPGTPYSLDNLEIVTFNENKRRGGNKEYKPKQFMASKVVYQFTLEGTFIKGHLGLLTAADAVGASKSAIANCVTGKSKSSFGFIWTYTKPGVLNVSA